MRDLSAATGCGRELRIFFCSGFHFFFFIRGTLPKNTYDEKLTVSI